MNEPTDCVCCHGTGRVSFWKLCPWCLGSGKSSTPANDVESD